MIVIDSEYFLEISENNIFVHDNLDVINISGIILYVFGDIHEIGIYSKISNH